MSNKVINSKNVRKTDRRKFKYVLQAMVMRNVRTKYRNSTLGVIWTILRPLLEMAVYWLIFSQFFAKGDPIYHMYLLCGMIGFEIVAEATMVSLPSIVANQGLMRQTKLTYEVFPLSNTISSLVNFLFSFAAMFLILIITQIVISATGTVAMVPQLDELGQPLVDAMNNPIMVEQAIMMFSPTMLLIVLWLPCIVIFAYGISMFVSAAFVFFRDVQHFYGIFLTLWRFATPLFYKIDQLELGKGSFVQTLLQLNPMTQYVTFFRDIMIKGAIPDWTNFVFIFAWALVAIAIGELVFKKSKRNFILYV